jgi:hypothetical protein
MILFGFVRLQPPNGIWQRACPTLQSTIWGAHRLGSFALLALDAAAPTASARD